MADRRPTSADVARRSGVSRSVVSVVLNGSSTNTRVSEATRQVVIAVAEELGYRPNRTAQALRGRRSGVIGFIPRLTRGSTVDDTVPFIMSLELSRAAVRRGLHMIEASAETQASRESPDLVDFLLDWRVDGVIVDIPRSVPEVQRLIDAGIVVVQLFRTIEEVRTPRITVDPAPGMLAAVGELVRVGHRRVAYIGRVPGESLDEARTAAFRTALEAHGLDDDPVRLRLAPNYRTADGIEQIRALLRLPAGQRPTAVVVGGDPAAIGVLQELHAVRVRVPDEMSVISFDDAIAAYTVPPLTSVAQPFAEIADRALDLIAEANRRAPTTESEDATEPTNLILPTGLRIRDSVAPPSIP